MLRVTPSPSADAAADTLDEMATSLRAMLQILRRQKWVIGGFAAGAAGLAAVYCAAVTPQYTARAQLLIDSQQTRALDLGNSVDLMDSSMVDSQVEILKSERIVKAVIKDLKLVEKAKEAREAGKGSGFLANTLGVVFPFLFNSAPASDYQLERGVIGDFIGRMSAERLARSYVITLSYRSPDPAQASEVANHIAEAYVVDQLESKYQATRRASVWLQDRINELRDQALAADRAVQEFKARNNIVDTGKGGLVSDQQLSELNSQLVAAQAQVAEAQARNERLQKIIQEGSASGFSDEMVSDVMNSAVFSRLRTQYLDAVKREEDWSKRYGPDHIAVVNLRSEIKGLQRALFNELTRIGEIYKSDLEIARAREDSLRKSFDELVARAKLSSKAQVDLRELESTAQSYRTLYDNFLQRYMQATQQQSFPITEARLITDASPPLAPSEPKKKLIIPAGFAIGLVLGIGAALWREKMNRSIRLPAEVEQFLRLDCLGVLPRFAPSVVESGTKGFESATGPMRQAVLDPFSRFSETLRAVKVSADVSMIGSNIKIIGVISTLPDEGKSTVSVNFAELIAHSGVRCILVDADLRNPSLTRQFAPKQKVGLLEVILGTATLDEVMIVDPMTKLRFLPSVVPSHISHSNEILASDKMRRVLDELKQHADYIILDLPPVAPVVDVLASTHLVDGYVYVLEWGASHRDLVISTLQNNPKIYEKILGCLLNKADLSAMRHLEDYGSKYYYHKYYRNYGRDA